jgi:murein DD-endopeptidase MepM/ murein hydrolase activator NlpD
MNKLLLICCVCLPLRHLEITSDYGFRVHPLTGEYRFHAGIDLRAHRDTVYAVLPGTVLATGYNKLLGLYIRVGHGDFQSGYGHLSQIFVLPGDTVLAGSVVGLSGSSGLVTGEHLHFSIQYRNHFIDPLAFLYKILKQQIK